MSLQIWLPLNGDLHNQGLSNIQFSNNGATVDTSGKIGKCYLFNGSSSYLKATYNFYNNKYSICTWIYSTSSSATQTICCDRTAVGSGLSIFLISGKLRIDSGGNSVQWSTGYTYPINTWFHLAITYDGTYTSYYINGEFKGKQEATISSSYWGNTTSIGASQSNNSSYANYLNGKLNDFRIYNHCLFQKEVKEIAKGLILHYKLDSSINYSTNLLTTTKATTTTKYNAYQVNMSPNFTAEEPYTLQLGGIDISHTGKTADTLRVSVYWGGGYIPLCDWTGTNYIVNGKADYLKATFIPHNTHANSANSWINIYNSPPSVSGTMSLTIKGWRLTPGNSVPFIPDVSGYNNNGEIMGNISFTTDTPKYNNSISFSNTAGKIRPQNFNSAGLTNSYTFAWWQYNTSTGNMAWGFSDGNRTNLYQTTTMSWNTGDGNTNQFKTSSNSTLSAATYQNKWTHFCITGDGTTTKLYINGSYAASATTYKPITGNNLWISGWDASTSYTFNGSKLSDFRVYATTLSDKDIAELYNTSSSIDNKGNVYARELVEE